MKTLFYFNDIDEPILKKNYKDLFYLMERNHALKIEYKNSIYEVFAIEHRYVRFELVQFVRSHYINKKNKSRSYHVRKPNEKNQRSV